MPDTGPITPEHGFRETLDTLEAMRLALAKGFEELSKELGRDSTLSELVSWLKE